MAKFTNKIIKFFSLILLSCALFSLPYSHQVKRQFCSKPEIIVLGDSRLANGFNNKNTNNCTLNLAISAESYYFARIKLEFLIQEHIPSSVILGYSTHNMSGAVDSLWVFGQGNVSHHLSKYYPLLSCQELKYITSKYGYTAIINSIPSILKKGPYAFEKYLFDNTLPYIGGYVPLANDGYFGKTNKSDGYKGVSSFQYENLLLIDSICELNNIKLYLVNTPNLVKQDTSLLQATSSHLKSTFKYLDYSDSIKNLDFFYDEHHLNERGSLAFTDMLLKKINVDH